MKKYFLLIPLFLIGTFFTFSFYFQKKENEFREKLLHLIRECVCYNDSISKKTEILQLIDQLESHDFVLEKGNDNLRVKFVSLQGCIEHVLACFQALHETESLIGMIHTPLPATPLCTEPENVDLSLLDESIRYDLDKLLTVRSRAHIVREYLIKGGKLYILYPEGGLEKRSLQQQKIYKQELCNFPHSLIDWTLCTQEMNPEMIGATYFFRNMSGEIYSFSIKSKQAIDPKELSEWGIWLGEVKNPCIKKRITELFEYFDSCKGPSRKAFHV